MARKTMIKVTLTNTLAYYSAMSFPDSKCFVEEKKSCTTDRVAPSVSKKQKFANKKKIFFSLFLEFHNNFVPQESVAKVEKYN